MEKITCNACKAFYESYDGSRHQCRLGYAIECNGISKFIEMHTYGPVGKCPRPLTEEKLQELYQSKDKK